MLLKLWYGGQGRPGRVHCREMVHYLVKDLRETLPFSNITHREEDHKPNPATKKRSVSTEVSIKRGLRRFQYPVLSVQRFHQRSNALVLWSEQYQWWRGKYRAGWRWGLLETKLQSREKGHLGFRYKRVEYWTQRKWFDIGGTERYKERDCHKKA